MALPVARFLAKTAGAGTGIAPEVYNEIAQFLFLGQSHYSSEMLGRGGLAAGCGNSVAPAAWNVAGSRAAYAPRATSPLGVQAVYAPSVVRGGTAMLTGHYNPDQMLRLTIALQPPHWAEERQFLKELRTAAKGSPQSQRFLTAEEWNARFAPSVQDEQAVVDWAQSQGLTVTQRWPNRLLVDVAAPAGVVEKAFQVTINSYEFQTRFETRSFFSNDVDPKIPANLTGIVQAVIGLNNWERMRPGGKAMKEPPVPDYLPGPVLGPRVSSQGNGDRTKLPHGPRRSNKAGGTPNITNGAYDPTDIYSSEAYDYNALYNQGHCCNPLGGPNSPPEASIAIVTVGSQNFGDIVGFHNQYPYIAWNITEFGIDGQSVPCTGPTDATCDGEGTLDMEWCTATSNSFGSLHNTGQVFLYDVPGFGNFPDAYNAILSGNATRVATTSWSCTEFDGCSSGFMSTLDAIFGNLVGQGWTLVAAQGDRGATLSELRLLQDLIWTSGVSNRRWAELEHELWVDRFGLWSELTRRAGPGGKTGFNGHGSFELLKSLGSRVRSRERIS